MQITRVFLASTAFASVLTCVLPAWCAETTGTTPAATPRAGTVLNFAGVSLADALDALRDSGHFNLIVEWRELEAAGVSRETVINLRLRDVTFRTALRLILNEAAGGAGTLAYYVKDGTVVVTSRDAADAEMVTFVYPVADLLVEVPDFEAPDLNLQQAQQTSGGRGGGGGGSIFSGGGGDDDQPNTREERAQQLIDTITETIRPEVWAVNGGRAQIRYFNGNLVVTAPRSVHESLGAGVG